MDNNTLTKLVELEYYDNDRVQIMRLNSMTREAVDSYVELIQSELVENEETIVRAVQDFTNLGGTITPYFMGRVKEFAGDNMRTDTRGRIAIVSNVELFRLMFNPVIKLFTRGNRNLDILFFTNVNEAKEWVSEYEA